MAVEIDENKLKALIQASQLEFPEIDPYFIYTLAVDHLLQEQGIFPDKDIVDDMIEKRKQNDFKVEILDPLVEYPNGGYAPEGQIPDTRDDSDDSDDEKDDEN